MIKVFVFLLVFLVCAFITILCQRSRIKELESWGEDCLDLMVRQIELNKKLYQEIHTLHPYVLHYGNLKTEIVREFADRLTDRADLTQLDSCNYAWLISQKEIDNLVEEMTEDN